MVAHPATLPTHVVHSVAELSDWLLQDSMRAPRD